MIKKQTESLNFLRFIAALIVINFHFGRSVTEWSPSLIAGPQMVTFFFVLSGFVMMVRYGNESIINENYWRHRFIRIAPAYYFSLIISLILFNKNESIKSILLNIFFLQSWISPHPLSVNSTGWSLSVEIFFYGIFPYLFSCLKKNNKYEKLSIIFYLCIWIITQIIQIVCINTENYKSPPSSSHDIIYYFPLSHVGSFLIGIISGLFFLKLKYKISHWFLWINIFTVLIFICITKNQAFIQTSIGYFLPFESSLLAPLFAIIIFTFPLIPDIFRTPFESKFATTLGNISYEMYIFQIPIWFIFNKIFPSHPLGTFLNYIIYLFVLIYFSFIFEKNIKYIFKKQPPSPSKIAIT